MPTPDDKWWRHGVVYQIYPLSFVDSDGDGYGDLAGIVSRLDYLADTLGIDAVWLSPFYRSPMRDWGYDVADHTDVDPKFGRLDDARTLIDEAHRRGIKVVVDYVINHTSDQHPWFIESRASRDNPKRDWYVWRDGRDDGPPTNWVSVFSGPAWSYDDTTGQWYRHTYLREQPDLDWRNPEVAEAMFGVARFWLDLGVDGFRVDAAHQMMKDPRERDNPPAPSEHPRPYKDMGEYDHFVHLYDLGHPDVHEVHRRLREITDSYGRDVLTVGEVHIFDYAEWASYYGEDFDQLTMPFNFQLMSAVWNAPSLRATIEAVLWNVPLGGWTNWTLGNHDEIRLATRLPDGHERLAALLLLTLRGTPFLYYGDELGMRQGVIPADQARDPWGLNVEWLSRDGARTPMQWSAGPNAGFGATTPWLPVGADWEERNVETELAEPGSTLNLYRDLLTLRKAHEALRIGSYLGLELETDDVLGFRRETGSETLTVLVNLSDQTQTVTTDAGSVLFSTGDPRPRDPEDGSITLSPLEGVILA